jgi:hypothetical protein
MQKSGGVQYLKKSSFLFDFPPLASRRFSMGKDRCGGVQRAKFLRKRDWIGKDPSCASTKEMAVELEKVLAVWLVWKQFLDFQKRSYTNWPLASPSA